MAAKIDSSSAVVPRHGQSTVSSVVSASSSKVSKFGAKSGFVIPKNKLSGSLVPIFRGGSKADTSNNVKEESIKQVQRKTKWGADLTQDAAVRKGRALAYQTRVEQITQQLSGALESANDQGSWSPKQDSSQQSATDHADEKAKTFELLVLEKRELIGEILRLNPSYKTPPDYKPLLKEGKVPIPVKAYPGYNFIGLLLGPESNTQKRLEEETGAKIHVYGTKENSKEKREITQSDIKEAQDAYEELYVNVSADTYEKVDAAVSLIELLVTPVSGNAAVVSKNSTSVVGDNVKTTTADVDLVVPQPMLVSAQFQQPLSASWFSIAPNAPPRAAVTGFFPQLRGPPFLQPNSFGAVPRSHLLLQPKQPPPPPRNQIVPRQNQPIPGQQPPPPYPFMSAQPSQMARPLMTAPSPPIVPLQQRPNMIQMAPQPFRHPQLNMNMNIPNNILRPPPANFASFSLMAPPQIGSAPMPAGISSSTPRAPLPPPTSVQSTMTFVAARPLLSGVPAPMQQAPPLSQPRLLPSVAPINPPAPNSAGKSPVSAPKPLRPSLADFTFQPLKTPGVAESPTTPRPNTPSFTAAPQAPSYRPASQNPNTPSPALTPFSPNSTNLRPPPMFPFPNSNTITPTISPSRPIAPPTQMGPPRFSPAPPPPPVLASPLPTRPPNFLPPANNPGGFVVAKPVISLSGQTYDPFSPTSAPPQQVGVKKQETDAAEYEDLMASVGVK